MKLNKEEIKIINLEALSSIIIENEFKNYFLDEPGNEHYKLLAWFSQQYNGQTIIDIGTYKGCSALAMSYNPKVNVKSFDIRLELKRLFSYPGNIEFIIDDITKEEYKKIIMSSPFILLDTDHDGPFENKFYQYLKQIEWKGTLLLDDIRLNQPMKNFWKLITEEKYDITEVGHHSGTGLVIFK
jgi:hypothetical protein